jgi:pimeloyl-ACP methyl ester carboxylesterase
MSTKDRILFLITFFLFSSNLFAQSVAYDSIIQANARQSLLISANELGQYNWSNCYSKLPRDLVVFETSTPGALAWAGFSGGLKVGSSWQGDYGSGTCQGLYGYASVRKWIGSGETTQLFDTINVRFSPKKLSSVAIVGKPLQNYVITINDAFSRDYISPESYDFHRFQRSLADLGSIGFTTAQLSNVTKISIKAVDPDWAFAINGVWLSSLDNGTSIEPEPPPVPRVENPVVFVPGVGASELKEENARIKWLSPNLYYMGDDLEDLKLPSNRNIFATDVFRGSSNQIYLNNRFPATFYQKLLTNFFTSTNGLGLSLKEYEVAGIPAFRTTSGCDIEHQDNTDENLKPKLFVFAYDWRRNNVETAAALKDYIGCVKRFYPNKKVRIVAHSMGGLVARRYALNYPNDDAVDKIITIGTPFLGAPRGIHSLETGSFLATAFGGSPAECGIDGECLAAWAVNRTFANKLKSAMETFPGPLQLLPSWYYYRLNQIETNSSYLSVRKSDFSKAVDYNYAEARDWLNERHAIQPGDIAQAFHMETHQGLQDDWRQGTGNIKFYHIYGQQSSNVTVGRVEFSKQVSCIPINLNCFDGDYFKPIPTNGDGTVPLLSSRRISSQDNFNATQAKRYIENARTHPLEEDNRTKNDSAEHTKLTENSRVQKRIEKILLNDDDYSEDDATIADNNDPITQGLANTDSKLAPTSETQSFYVSLHNVTGYHLGPGPSSPDFASTTSGPNGSQAIPIGENAVWLGLPATGGYYVSFYGDGSPMKIQVLKGFDYDRLEQQFQYIDVVIPSGAVARLYLTPFGLPRLTYDADNDGTFDTDVDYTVFVEEENAKDLEVPVVSFDYQTQAAGKLVTLSATDNLSGVRQIYYSLDGQQFNEYIEPVAVNAGQNLFVFAEDNNRNRTGIGQIDVAGTTYSIGNRIWFDVNNDGKINQNEFPEEIGINGVSVSLFADTNGDGQPDNLTQPLKTTTTSNGYYRFGGLNAGIYVVRVNPVNFADNGILQGYLNTTIQTSDDTDSDSTQAGENGILPNGQRNNIQNVGVLSGSITLGPNLSEPQNETDVSGSDKGEFDKYSNLTVDFGFYRLGLSGTVWNDTGNRNGYLDNGENGLANYRVKLFQSSGEIPVGNDGILGTSDDSTGGILTDANGIYTFQGLENGDYSVKVTRQFANASPQTSVNPNDNADSDNNGSLDADSPESAQISSLPVTISSANRGLLENTRINEFAGLTENPTVDFGLFFTPTAANANVSGKIVNLSGNGINRAIVKIQSTTGSFTKTGSTNNFGRFNFTDIPAGNDYIITVNHKRYVFESQLISVEDSIGGIIISSNN